MKKYLITFLFIFLMLFVGCKKDPEDQDKVTTADPIEAVHEVNVDGDEVSPYLLVQSVLNENNDLIYSLTYISIFPKNYSYNGNEFTLTGRFYDYYQVDYLTESGKYENYFHKYDYLDSTERSYGQNFMPSGNFKEQLDVLRVLVKYRFTRNGNEENKEIKFQEEIIKFDSTKYNQNDLGNYQVKLIKNKNQSEPFNRYKLSIDLDDNITTGHYDIQTWVEINGKLYPFVGYYHYRPNHGDIYTLTDIEVSDIYSISKIYYNIRYYNNDDVMNIYYVEELQ